MRVPVMVISLVLATAVSVGVSADVAPSPFDQAWNRYVSFVEGRRASEVALGTPDRYLALDFASGAAETRRRLLAGEIVTTHLHAWGPTGDELEVPNALVHHWRGAVFVPHATVASLVARLEDGPPPQDDVLRATVLSREQDHLRVYLRLQRKKIVTVVYNTEHDVRFARVAPDRAASTSIATRIAEVRDPDSPTESEYAPGDDHGFLWKLNSYWRYVEVPGGVIAECESITLSRSVPFMVRTIVNPLVESTARESLERTLSSLRGL